MLNKLNEIKTIEKYLKYFLERPNTNTHDFFTVNLIILLTFKNSEIKNNEIPKSINSNKSQIKFN